MSQVYYDFLKILFLLLVFGSFVPICNIVELFMTSLSDLILNIGIITPNLTPVPPLPPVPPLCHVLTFKDAYITVLLTLTRDERISMLMYSWQSNQPAFYLSKAMQQPVSSKSNVC